jgi:alpha,alpha-trehalase
LPDRILKSSRCISRSSFFLVFLLQCHPLHAQAAKEILVNTDSTIHKLLSDEDTDGDHKITINDCRIPGTERGDKRFTCTDVHLRSYQIAGTYYLSNLLQELQLLREAGKDTGQIRFDRIYESPVHRISRSIRELYWHGLTRRIDESGLPSIVRDPKTRTKNGIRYLYVPPSDTPAVEYFDGVSRRHPDWNIKVVQLSKHITPAYVKSLDEKPGILSLALDRNADGTFSGAPFVVPGGRFNEMYGWDSYFIVLGLLHDGVVSLAKSIVENFIYEIEHYGAILNANRTYYLTRSQPPFLTSMALACAQFMPDDSTRHAWFQTVLQAAIQEYNNVWMNPRRRTPIGLNRYFDSGSGIPPEVEPGHYDRILAMYAKKHRMGVKEFEREYEAGTIKDPDLDRFFVNDRAMRESGHDTSYRLLNRCADLATVDLNSLLYKIERDIGTIIEQEFGGSYSRSDGGVEKSVEWFKKAENRRELIDRYLWDAGRGMFFDYDVVQRKKTYYVSATTFYPMWAGLATAEQARLLVQKALPLLEMPGGIVSSTEESRGPITINHPLRQWDYPFGWAPHQMLVWQGMRNYGYDGIARRLAYRWLFTITLNAYQFNGTVTEKYDVVKRSHEVFAEYGNIGTKFSYITEEGFGWTDASYQIGVSLLNDSLRSDIDQRIPPEWIFDAGGK